MAYQQVPVPRRNSPRTLRIVLIVVGAVLLVCCIAGVIGGRWLYGAAKDAMGPARDATTGYVEDLRSGDYPGAYGRLCDRTRSTITQEEFARRQSAQPKITKYEIVGLNVTNRNGRVGGTATVRLTQDTGADVTQVFQLVKEDGGWRICQ